LSVFMVLPGPARPLEALQSMLETARGLAKALNAELYDSDQRAPLTTERERELRIQVEEWARRSAGARSGA
jgi:cell division protein ZipA